MSVNKVILIGRLGKDPEVRYMTNGDAVANATLVYFSKIVAMGSMFKQNNHLFPARANEID